MGKIIMVIGLIISAQLLKANSSVAHVKFPEVAAQVKFQSVVELNFNHANQKISYGPDPLQHGLLWQPPKHTGQPLIVMVHGGCWLNAFGVDHTFPMATALAQYGFPVWSLEYRRTGDAGGGWPGSFDDIKLALSQLNRLHEFGINTNSYVLMGHSAGGHLALLAASELTENQPQKVIGLAAITDVSRYAMGQNSCQKATPQFMNGMPQEQPAAYQQASLVYRQLPKQTVLLQGNADNIVPLLQSQLNQVQSEISEGAGHFDWIHPGSPAFKQLLEQITTNKK